MIVTAGGARQLGGGGPGPRRVVGIPYLIGRAGRRVISIPGDVRVSVRVNRYLGIILIVTDGGARQLGGGGPGPRRVVGIPYLIGRAGRRVITIPGDVRVSAGVNRYLGIPLTVGAGGARQLGRGRKDRGTD